MQAVLNLFYEDYRRLLNTHGTFSLMLLQDVNWTNGVKTAQINVENVPMMNHAI